MNNLKNKIKRIIINCIHKPLPYSLNKNIELYNTEILDNKLKDNEFIYCNINFDDQSPVFGQIKGRDYGGQINKGLSNKLLILLEENPEIAITSFVVPNFLGNTRRFKNKFLLSNLEYTEWIKWHNNLADRFNIEYAIHGFYHLQKENPFFQPYTEYAFKNQIQSEISMNNAINVFTNVGWKANGFRQPGWDISSSINLPKLAKQFNLAYIASNSYDAGYNTGGIERVSNYYPTLIDGVINFPQNLELDWPLKEILKKIDFLVEIKALISIKAHFVDRDVCNCLNEYNLIKLQEVINYLKNNHKVKFATLNEISDFVRKENNHIL